MLMKSGRFILRVGLVALLTSSMDKYTLFDRGVEVITCDDLPWLERGLNTLEPTRSTYIRFNETGIQQYTENKGENDED